MAYDKKKRVPSRTFRANGKICGMVEVTPNGRVVLTVKGASAFMRPEDVTVLTGLLMDANDDGYLIRRKRGSKRK